MMIIRDDYKRWKHVFAHFTSLKNRVALQVARKIASCDRALIIQSTANPFFPYLGTKASTIYLHSAVLIGEAIKQREKFI